MAKSVHAEYHDRGVEADAEGINTTKLCNAHVLSGLTSFDFIPTLARFQSVHGSI
jgi:hypothetical protein